MKFSTVGGALALASTALASEGFHKYSYEEYVVMSCKGAVLSAATFCEKDTVKTYKCDCKNKPALGSWINCIYDKLGENDKHGEKIVEEYCSEYNVTLDSEKLQKAYANATKYIVDTTKIDGFNKTAIFDTPVQYNKKKYVNYYNSYKARWGNVEDTMYLGAGLLGYWAVIFLVATIWNFLNKVAFINKAFHSKFVNTIRSKLSLSSLFANKKHSTPIQFLKVVGGFVPLRIETIVIFFYFALLFIFSGVRYTFVQNDTIWKPVAAQAARYPGDRTGVLALYSLQLTFLFAGRNNFLMWLTGWKQSTFITYHKWISRFNFIMVLIHAGSMHQQSVGMGYDKFVTRLHTFWYRWGIVAAAFMGGLVFTAAYQVRKTFYEVFLGVHIVFAAIFLAASWIHATQFGYEQFTYALAAIWCFDRFVRILRLISFGTQDAKVTIISEETLKVVIPKRSYWKAFPGSYGYLHYLTPTTFFQSHPFTIIETSDKEITFVTKIKGGVTSQIYNQLKSKPGQTGIIKISVEGPYGNPTNVTRYDTALLYSGSTGIAGPYSHALKSVQSGKNQQVKLYWIIRHWSSIDWFVEELVKLKNTGVEVIIYVSQPDSAIGSRFNGDHSSSNGSDSEQKSEKLSSNDDEKSGNLDSLKKQLDFIEFRYGRPQINEIVHNDFSESQGTIGIWTAGHNSMVDDIRSAVGENLNVAKGRVDFFDELQVW
ncbi:Ferric reductase transmembrane component [Wickerhamomyces ciferrii]|uniref:Ferric reductase transmembrane component n=1 Tax=Wickerhamomyces ciferrii (strain ATCC 14091 / BCRC 22168 / CBS 111 / JCM 3599 / NBRC 0793 / NRRL Y-1031 F-60-10) TaxID=1206466 RepID=K0KSF7_WICCF|nr:Ferric reductase transmembrane component [Wickerhamomyces ciferrii]CCH46106.1 Ferric reductase transmembrane component [Wickerhamomyces ciferrii]